MLWKIEKRNINELKSYEKNPRKFTRKGLTDLKESIKNCGDANIITINLDNTVLGGHARLKVMKQLGFKDVDVKVPDRILNEQEVKEIVVRLNANTAGDWDITKLNEFFDKDYLKDWGLDIDFGLNSNKKEVIEDEIPEKPSARCKQGQVWQLGRHKLICGDCTNNEVIKVLMGNETAHLYLTDPPYNVDYEGEAGKLKNDNMSDNAFSDFLSDAFLNAAEYLKPGSSFYIWHADSQGYIFRKAVQENLGTVRQCLIWLKNSMVMGRQDYQWIHEPCLYGWTSGDSHLWASDRKQTTVLQFDRPQKSKEHPTMKPVKLFDYLIRNNTRKDDIVLDTFAGSGTSLIACEQNGRICYCCELDEHYCDIIIERFEKLTGIKAFVL